MTAASALFVYYKLPESLSPDWPDRVAASQAALKARLPLLHTRLMRRADVSSDGRHLTWMEVYDHPGGLSEDLQGQILQAMAPLNHHLHGERHIERFVDVASSATHPPYASDATSLGST